PPLRDWDAARVPTFGAPDEFGVVGESWAAWRLRDAVAFTAARGGHVLITGQSGSGKELVARAIHALSARRDRELVARNAATLPESLVDAELFGNAAGYPNAGMQERPGLVGRADGSTLFLDEIGELPVGLQAHLLRVLDGDGEYHRLGSAETLRCDLRLVAATNRDPDELKHDLLARLRLRVAVPSLSERREDVPLIVRHLLRQTAERDETLRQRFFDETPEGPVVRLSAALMVALTSLPYRLAVRELDSWLWRALSASRGDRLELPEGLEAAAQGPQTSAAVRPDDLGPDEIQAALQLHDGVQERAWRHLGLKNRYALIRLINKHGLKPT
ncbi:MAG: sigma 54-interacting transcriptional regulator, partial [Myxococcota bacterium]